MTRKTEVATSAALIGLGVLGGVRFAVDLATTPWARMDTIARLNSATAAIGACTAIMLGTSVARRAFRKPPAESWFEEIPNKPEMPPPDAARAPAEAEPRAAAS